MLILYSWPPSEQYFFYILGHLRKARFIFMATFWRLVLYSWPPSECWFYILGHFRKVSFIFLATFEMLILYSWPPSEQYLFYILGHLRKVRFIFIDTFWRLGVYSLPPSVCYVYILDGLLYAMSIFVATIGILFFVLCLSLPAGIFVPTSLAYVDIQSHFISLCLYSGPLH